MRWPSENKRPPFVGRRPALRVAWVVLSIAGVLTASSCGREAARDPWKAPSTQSKVILVVIDGARSTEAFDDPSHRYVPRMWNELRRQGAIIGEFTNDGVTKTNPGHTSLLTGTWQTIANDGSERPTQPTVFEYYRKTHSAAKHAAYVVAGKAKLGICSYSSHPEYGPAYAAAEAAGNVDDAALFDTLKAILTTERPRLAMASFSTVDIVAHDDDWPGYLAALVEADSLIVELWKFLQSDPFYADQTYLIVTNDHGRHDDEHGGFRSHGDSCEGCRRLMFLAVGPAVRKGYSAARAYDQRDVCNTIASILRFPAVFSEGAVIEEIFENH